MFLFLALAVTILLIVANITELYAYAKRCVLAMNLPGPKAKILLGNCLDHMDENVMDTISNAGNSFGPVARIWLTLFPMFVLFEPQDIQTVMSSKKHTNKFFLYKYMHNFLGKGLITSSGDRWSIHRKYIQPFFTNAILERFVPCFSNSANKMVSSLEISANKPMNVTKVVNQCVLDILYGAILGIEVEDSSANMKESPFRQGKLQLCERLAKPWLLFDAIYEKTGDSKAEVNQRGVLERYTKIALEQRKNLGLKESFEPSCMLDYLLQIQRDHEDFSDKDVVDEACTLMLAGQDSVGSAVAFALYYLAANPECQKKCMEEIEVFEASGAEHNLSGLKYIDCCLKETLRLQPSVTMFGRKTAEDIICNGQKVYAGSDVLIIPYATHRLPHVYPDPEKYDPERFNNENTEKRHRFAYFPFSSGPRNCIGHQFAMNEMKVMLMTILKRFTITLAKDAKPLKPVFRVTVRARGGIWLQFEERNNNNTVKM